MGAPPYQTTSESGAAAAQKAISEVIAALNAEEVTISRLARKLKAELNARETKVFTLGEKQTTVVLKAYIAALSKMDPLPGDATEEQKDKRKKEIEKAMQEMLRNLLVYSKRLITWDVRQKARQDAHRLRGDYPPEEKRLAGPGGGPIPMKLYDFDDSKFPREDK